MSNVRPHMHTRHLVPLFTMVMSAGAFASDCKEMSVARRTQLSQAIFVGKVVSYEPLKSVRLATGHVFKGRVGHKVSVPTGRSDGDFFLPEAQVRIGESYLVFLTVQSGVVSVSRCLGSAPIAAAASDLAYLRTMQSAERRKSGV